MLVTCCNLRTYYYTWDLRSLLTSFDNIINVSIKYISHVSHHGEDNKPSEDAGSAVNYGYNKCVPEIMKVIGEFRGTNNRRHLLSSLINQ